MKKVNKNNNSKYPARSKIYVFLLLGIIISMLTQAAVAVDSSSCIPSDRIQIGFNYKNADGSWDPNEFNINNYLVQPIDKLKYIVVRYGKPNEGNTNVDIYLVHSDGKKSPLSLGYYNLGSVRFLESTSYQLIADEYKIEVYESNNCYSLIFPIVLKKTLTVGETWYLDNNYALTAQSINAKVNPRTVRLILSKDGSQIDDKIVSMGETYSYGNILSTKIDTIFSGATAEMVQFKETIFSFSGIQINSAPSTSTTNSQVAQANTQATQVPNYAPVETPLYIQPAAMPQQESTNWILFGGVLAIIAIGIVVLSKRRRERASIPGQEKQDKSDMGFVQCFAGLLLDSNRRVRYNAAYAIGYLADFGAFDKSTIYPLIGLLSDRSGYVRGSAAFALGSLAKQDVFDVASIKPLMRLLSDYNGIVRKNASEALKIFQEKDIIRTKDGGQVIVIKDSIIQHTNFDSSAGDNNSNVTISDSIVQRTNLGKNKDA